MSESCFSCACAGHHVPLPRVRGERGQRVGGLLTSCGGDHNARDPHGPSPRHVHPLAAPAHLPQDHLGRDHACRGWHLAQVRGLVVEACVCEYDMGLNPIWRVWRRDKLKGQLDKTLADWAKTGTAQPTSHRLHCQQSIPPDIRVECCRDPDGGRGERRGDLQLVRQERRR